MSIEQKNFNKEKLNSKPLLQHEILENLRKLQIDYFKSDSMEDKKTIENNQCLLLQELKKHAQKIINDINNPSISESERDKLMGQYGFIMDQIAINLPWSEIILGKERDIQNEALEKLKKYLEKHPRAKEVARSIFILFHHGAGIDKNLTIEAYKRLSQKQPPTKEFALQYIETENKGKIFLEKYIALTLGKEQFSLDNDYQQLINIKEMSDEQFSYIIDVANWYRRIAYYQKIAGLNKERLINAKKAIELHEKLTTKDPAFKQFLDAIYEEQDFKIR